MKIATWNVNGIRARGTEVLAFLETEAPDLLCLQELKATADQIDKSVFTGEKPEKAPRARSVRASASETVEQKRPSPRAKKSDKASAANDDSPLFANVVAPPEPVKLGLSAEERVLGSGASPGRDPLEDVLPGYVSFWHGGKAYSGVSIHVREAFLERLVAAHPELGSAVAQGRDANATAELRKKIVVTPPAFDFETRVLHAEIGPVTFVAMYAPNGGKDYEAKLAFWDALIPWSKKYLTENPDKSLILAGDLNIAHDDKDLHPTQRRVESNGLPPIGIRVEERERFTALLATGLVDVTRALHPDADRLFSWWPYWAKARARNLGWRIDYALVSGPLAATAKTAEIQIAYGTSDHAPLVVTFDRYGV